MPLRSAGLGLKLNVALLAFFLVLAAATLGVVAYGFKRTQDNATTRSNDALEELGKLALYAVAGGTVEQGGVRFESASEVGQRAERAMEAFRSSGATSKFDFSNLAMTEDGLRYDARPDRISDFIALPYANFDDPAVQDEIKYVAALDTVFDALFEGFEDEVGGRNFDPNAIGFVGAQGTGRYYPPRGIHTVIPADLDLTNLLERAGPSGNPTRRTTWTRPYEDSIGQGLVVTAETPIYEGDTFRGVIQVDLLITKLIDEINGIKPTPGGFAFYVDVDGAVMHTDAFDMLTAEATTNASFAAILDRMLTDTSESGIAVDSVQLNGEEFFIAHAAMPSLGGSFGVAAPVSEITAEAAAITRGIDREANRTLLAMSAALGALFLATLAGAGYLNRRVVLNPIGALLQGTRAVGAGDLTTRVEVQSRDELGDLASGFNSMVDDLSEIERRYQRVFESTSDGLTISRLDGTLVEANAAACAMHGYTKEEFLNLPSGGHVHPDFRERRMRFQETVRAGQATSVRAVDIRKDGSSFDVDVRGVPFEYRGEPHVLTVLRDVTAEVRQEQTLEERVEERTRELQLLLDVSQNVASTLDIERLATRILEQLRAAIAFDGAAVLLVEGVGIRILEAYGRPDSDDIEEVEARWFAGPPGGPGRLAMERRRPIVVPDVRQDEALAAWAREVPGRAATGRSWLSAPLVVQDRVLGVLNLWSSTPGAFEQRHADLASSVANQAAVAVENARLFQQASVVAAVEERQRLARELHDSVSQALYGIALGAQTAKQLAGDDSKAAQPIDYVLSLADTGLAEMRALIFELRPESLATEGLVSALEKQAAATSARYGLRVRPSLSAEPDLPLATKEALYRVAQEALHNAVKHAQCTAVTIRLGEAEGTIRLEIADDGVGFDASGDFPGHLGLRSMAERLEAAGGMLTIDSAHGKGTRVIASVPAPPTGSDPRE
ncbi:MAG: PAS domain S-box protein [Dehalococcoidia bacterium]